MNQMSFFEILTILEVYKENMEEQQKQQDKENKKMEKQMSSIQNKYNYNDMFDRASSNYSIAIFDIDSNVLYIYSLDT